MNLDFEKEILESINFKIIKHYSITIKFVFDKDYGFKAVPFKSLKPFSFNSDKDFQYHFQDTNFENFKKIVSEDLKILRDNLWAKDICKKEILDLLQDINFDEPTIRCVDGNYAGTELYYDIHTECENDYHNTKEGTFILPDKYIPTVQALYENEEAKKIFNRDDTTKILCSKIFLAGVLALKERYLDTNNNKIAIKENVSGKGPF